MSGDEADVHDVAACLGKTVQPETLDRFEALQRLVATAQRLVATARRRGNDCGTAALAGYWLGQGMSENEITARLWPKERRFSVVAKVT